MSSTGYIVFVLILVLNILQSNSTIVDSRPDSALNFTEIAGKYGYYTEQHTVTTEDGYLLTMFRMKGKQCQKIKRPLVMMHGLSLSSDGFLDAGPGVGLAYLLADDCQDLWVGNFRGNYYARNHTSLDPDTDAEFWNFCMEDMGYYDVPATIDYVLNQTGVAKVNYLGYSQGGGSFIIMCSERPGYCDKVNLFVGLAPASRGKHLKSALSRTVLITIRELYQEFSIDVHGVFAKDFRDLSAVLAKSDVFFPKLLRDLLWLIDSPHPGSISDSVIRTLVGHFPGGTSLKTIEWYAQSLATDKFRKFDSGTNSVIGIIDSPTYNLSAVTVPAAIIYGENDGLASPYDVKWLAAQLPALIECTPVPDPLWAHFDHVYSRFIPISLYPKIQAYLSKYG